MTAPQTTPVARALQALRQERGHAIKTMSEALGVSPTMLTMVERGERNPPAPWIDRLREAYQLSEEDVIVLTNAFDATRMARRQLATQKARGATLTPFGVWLRQYRLATGITLTDMASVLGVSGSMLSYVENGKRNIPDGWLERLIETYALDGELLAGITAAHEQSNLPDAMPVSGLGFDERRLVRRFADIVGSLDATNRDAVSLWLETLEASQEGR